MTPNPAIWTREQLASIPDDVLFSETQRRRARLRKSYTGGIVWSKHNPETNRCRCAKCTAARLRPAEME